MSTDQDWIQQSKPGLDPGMSAVSPKVDVKGLKRGDPENDNDVESIHSKTSDMQAGVQKAIILRKAWSIKTLSIAFASLFITSLVIIFSDYAGLVVEPYVTSTFRQHSAMLAARVVSNIIRICAFPVIAKLSDVFGRAEMFTFSIGFQTIAFILWASTNGMGQFISGNLFDAIGSTGFVLTQQVFIADATSLVNRAFWSTLPESITTLPALYVGSIIGESFLTSSAGFENGWRWSYGTWAIATPIVAVPLIAVMLMLQRRAKNQGLIAKSLASISGCDIGDPVWKKIFFLALNEMDLFGMLLLSTGLALILVPLSLTGAFNSTRWSEPEFIAMLVLGVVILVAFSIWEWKFAKNPCIPKGMYSRTVLFACLIQVFDFMEYTLFTIMFPSFLQVAGEFSPGHATRIDNSLRVAFQVSGLLVAIGMRYWKRPLHWLLWGPPLVMLGQGLMIHFCDFHGGTANEASFVASKVISGIGRAFYQTAGQVAVQAAVSRQEVAVATGIFQASNNVGGAIGVACAGAIWRNTLPDKLVSYLPESAKDQAANIFGSIIVAQEYPSGSPERLAINQGYRESQRILAIVSTALCVPSLIFMLFIRDSHLAEQDAEDNQKDDRIIAKIEKQAGDTRSKA